MKISKVSCFDLNFSAKKKLYMDFDNTYFPFEEKHIGSINSTIFKAMYAPFIEYKKSQNDDLEMFITTGRSQNNYIYTQNLIKESGLDYCYPDGLVSSSGANAFKFVDGKPVNIYPDNDPKAEGVIDEIKNKIHDYDGFIHFVECKINGSRDKYQNYSSEYQLSKIRPERYISIEREGKYNAQFVVSKKIDFNAVSSLITKYVQDNNLPFSVRCHLNDDYTKGFEYSIYEGQKQVPANVIFLKYSKNGEKPNKADIIKNEVKKIQDSGSDDIIIVAGDAHNDEEMLNPLNYIKGSKNINDPECRSQLAKLPLRSIICGERSELNFLRSLAEELHNKGIDIMKLAPNSRTGLFKAIKEFDEENENKNKA